MVLRAPRPRWHPAPSGSGTGEPHPPLPGLCGAQRARPAFRVPVAAAGFPAPGPLLQGRAAQGRAALVTGEAAPGIQPVCLSGLRSLPNLLGIHLLLCLGRRVRSPVVSPELSGAA